MTIVWNLMGWKILLFKKTKKKRITESAVDKVKGVKYFPLHFFDLLTIIIQNSMCNLMGCEK